MIKQIKTKMCPPENSTWTKKTYNIKFEQYVKLQPQLDSIALMCGELITKRNNNYDNYTCSFTAEFSDSRVLLNASFKIGIALGLNGLDFDIHTNEDFSLMEKYLNENS